MVCEAARAASSSAQSLPSDGRMRARSREHTWQARADVIVEALGSLLEERGQRGPDVAGERAGAPLVGVQCEQSEQSEQRIATHL